jgi:hypothetical protein
VLVTLTIGSSVAISGGSFLSYVSSKGVSNGDIQQVLPKNTVPAKHVYNALLHFKGVASRVSSLAVPCELRYRDFAPSVKPCCREKGGNKIGNGIVNVYCGTASNVAHHRVMPTIIKWLPAGAKGRCCKLMTTID